MPVDSLNQTAEGIPDSNPKECALVPAATIIAFLVNPDNSNAQPDTAVMQAAAARLGQKLIVLSARTDQDIDLAFQQQALQALVVNTDAFFLTRRNQLASLEVRYAIPTIHDLREY